MSRCFNRIFKGEHAERTGGCEDFCAQFPCVLNTNLRETLAHIRRGFCPHLPSATFATQTLFTGPVHLVKGETGDGGEKRTRLIENIILVSQKARVVIGDDLFNLPSERELAFLQPLRQDLGSMENFEFPLGVLVFKNIKAVGACGENMIDPIGFEALDISFHQFFKETCLSHPPDFIATTLFLISENGKIYPYLLKDEYHGFGDFLDSRV